MIWIDILLQRIYNFLLINGSECGIGIILIVWDEVYNWCGIFLWSKGIGVQFFFLKAMLVFGISLIACIGTLDVTIWIFLVLFSGFWLALIKIVLFCVWKEFTNVTRMGLLDELKNVNFDPWYIAGVLLAPNIGGLGMCVVVAMCIVDPRGRLVNMFCEIGWACVNVFWIRP